MHLGNVGRFAEMTRSFAEFFRCATGLPAPYPYQARLAEELWPDMLDAPTGMGKTAAVTVAWLFRRRELKQTDMPRRLVWCLPMRVLVEQTAETMHQWLANLGIQGKAGEGKVSLHVLMGGEEDLISWAEYPDEDMILIGTQDMLLSRALMRGYGMSRFQWPVHFALLHNDSLWAFDEIQLMGAGLATSAQLEAFRRSFPVAKPCRSLWVSATLNGNWLNTVDMRGHSASLTRIGVGEADREQAGDRLNAIKRLRRAPLSLTREEGKAAGRETYLDELATLVQQHHDRAAQTLVILNRVDRAQQLFRKLQEQRASANDVLIHARFRTAERTAQSFRLRKEDAVDRIVVTTQAVEAGVDISSKILITELAPWSSLVQRFGRCNRYGEHNAGGASILWVDIEAEGDTLPYESAALGRARARLEALDNAGPHDLPPADEDRPLSAVLRRKDFLDLFNTDPDLAGFDVDVSDYIRDTGTPGVQVFWREFAADPNSPALQPRPDQAELCPVSMAQVRAYSKRKDRTLWQWDALDGTWSQLDREPRPGMTLLLRATDGGYDEHIGFNATLANRPVPVLPLQASRNQHAYGEDWRSFQPKAVALADHLGHVAMHAKALCNRLGDTELTAAVVRAARWHDLGKAHPVFQETLHGCEAAPPEMLAKSPCTGRHSRRFFRHELASMLAWLAAHDGDPDVDLYVDLVAYLIVAHHGKVRMSLRAMPTESADEGVKRFARGIWEGDELPAMEFDGEHSIRTILKLAIMELGEGEQGPSWTERALTVLAHYGPFRLSWMETLVRLADWRASADEQDRA